MNKKYKLKEVIKNKNKKNEEVQWFICDPYAPEYYTSLFLSLKGKNSDKTSSTYGTNLVPWLNFLASRNKDYWEVANKDIKDYFLELINFDSDGNMVNVPTLFYKTIMLKKTVIVSFYNFLSTYIENNTVEHFFNASVYSHKKNKVILQWDSLEKIINATIELNLTKYKTRENEYLKDYTKEEIKAIYSNFKSYRNRAIFLLSLFGMRIGEILSIKLKDYNPSEKYVVPSKSKGRGRSKKRTVYISYEVTKVLELYIINERNLAENIAKKQNDYVFINILKGDYIGNTMSPVPFRNALISAAKKSNIKEKVRTHSGRSHRATELTKLLIEGELELTDETIRFIMGWASPSTIITYTEHSEAKISENIAKKLAEINKLEGILDE